MIAYYIIGGVILAGIISLVPITYTLQSYYPYAYTNARLKAKQNQLISYHDLQRYAERSFEDIIYDLSQEHDLDLTKYLDPERSYGAIDTALRNHHIEAIRQLKRVSPERNQPFLKAYLQKFKIRVIKNLLRQRNVEIAETTKALPQALKFTLRFRDNPQPTIDEIKQELQHTPYAKIFNEHEDDVRRGSYDAFERDLNIHFLHTLKRHASTQTTKTYVQKKIDRLNLSSALKKNDVFANGGRLPTQDLQDASSLNDYLRVLHENGYDDIKADEKTALEQAFHAHIKSYAHTLQSKQPLSDNTIIAYLILKSHNVQNLNILLKLTYHETPPKRIKESLIA